MTRVQIASAQAELNKNVSTELMHTAIADFDHALKLAGTPEVYLLLGRGLAYMDWAAQCGNASITPVPTTEKAIADFDAVLELDPTEHLAQLRRGTLRMRLALWNRRDPNYDPLPLYGEAEADFTAVLEADPANTDALSGQAAVLVNRALYFAGTGKPSEPDFERAEAVYDRNLALRRGSAGAHGERAAFYGWWLQDRIRRGEDPTALAAKADADWKRVTEIRPRSPGPWIAKANAKRAVTMWRARRGDDTRKAWESIIDELTQAERLEGTGGFRARLWKGDAFSQLADALGRAGEDPIPYYRAAVKTLDTAIAVHARDSRGWYYRGVALQRWALTLEAHRKPNRDQWRLALRDFTEAKRLGHAAAAEGLAAAERALAAGGK